MNPSYLLRRATYATILVMLLAVAAFLVLQMLDEDAGPKDSTPVQTEEIEKGILTEEIVAEITAQATKNAGLTVLVTCPERIELITGYEIVCQLTEAEGETAGTLITEAIVTITDPGAAAGAKWTWRTTS